MRKLLALTVVVAILVMFGCDRRSPVSQTTFNLSQNQTNSAPVPSDFPVDNPTSAQNIMRLEPSSVSMNVGQNVNVRVVISTPAGNEIPTESLQVSIADSSVAALTQIDGRTLQLRGTAAGVTSALVMANGLTVSLIITVN